MAPGYMLIQGDSRSIPLADRSVHCVVTSPPYFGLRDYGTAAWEGGDDPACDHVGETPRSVSGGPGKQYTNLGSNQVFSGNCRRCGARRIDRQIGLEDTIEAYVATMTRVFREVWRVLRDDGTCWVNLGDSYNANQGAGFNGQKRQDHANRHTVMKRPPGLKPKDLYGIPWRVALALQADGWYLRSDIIWSKLNPMPESVTDRPTKSHEYMFLLAKRERYFWDADAVREPQSEGTFARFGTDGKRTGCGPKQTDSPNGLIRDKAAFAEAILPAGRNMRSVLTIPTEAFSGAHFATFPRRLVEPCIKAGTSERGCCPRCGAGWVRSMSEGHNPFPGSSHDHSADLAQGGTQTHTSGKPAGTIMAQRWYQRIAPSTLDWHPSCSCEPHKPVPCTVLDPFAGSGTTIVVANALGRHGVGLDLSREYLTNQAQRRIERPHATHLRPARVEPDLPLFASFHEENRDGSPD